MRILVTTGNFAGYIVPNFYDFLNEVAKYVDLTVWHETGDIHEILSQLDFQPDFIFINEFRETNSPHISGLDSLKIPYGVLLYDLHYQVDIRRQALNEISPPYAFSLYRDKFREWYPSLASQFIWFPHHINTEVFRDYGLPKDVNWLLMGSVFERLYPLRSMILQTMRGRPGFVYHEHPGWRTYSEAERKTAYVGELYAREINRAKMFFTCGSIYDYPLLKYFEVPACNTLLLASSFSELIDLGFVPWVHFVPINEYDFEDMAEYYLNHDNERIMIAQQGYEMVRENHSTSLRARQFVNLVRAILHEPLIPKGRSICTII